MASTTSKTKEHLSVLARQKILDSKEGIIRKKADGGFDKLNSQGHGASDRNGEGESTEEE